VKEKNGAKRLGFGKRRRVEISFPFFLKLSFIIRRKAKREKEFEAYASRNFKRRIFLSLFPLTFFHNMRERKKKIRKGKILTLFYQTFFHTNFVKEKRGYGMVLM
jgi:hypothetical protein